MPSQIFEIRNSKFEILKWLPPVGMLLFIFYPTFLWMGDRWLARDSYYSHGFLIPLVSLYWIFRKREALASLEKETDPFGLVTLALGASLQIMSSFFRIYFLSAFALVILLIGAIHFLFGRKVLAEVWFPVGFLLLMIPFPLLIISETTLKMKFFVADAAAWILNSMGLQAFREGSYIQMPHALLLVGDPCSGLRSFLAFLCLGLVFAYGLRAALWKRAVLVLAALPLALLSNIGRVLFLSLVGEIYGMKFVHGKLHDISGILAFVFTLFGFMILRQKLSHEK